jgi:hypothetical protein
MSQKENRKGPFVLLPVVLLEIQDHGWGEEISCSLEVGAVWSENEGRRCGQCRDRLLRRGTYFLL